MKALKTLVWRVLNFFQLLFFIFWSVVWQTISIIMRVVTFSSYIPLMIARYIWSIPLAAVMGARIQPAHGTENVDFSKPHVFVFNHQSTADIGVAFRTIPVPLRFVAKKELKYVPFLGWYMWATGMVFVDRTRGKKAIQSLERAGQIIRGGASVIAFPEGTRSRDGQIAPFKKGIFVVAIESGVPIVPCAIEGSRKVWPKGTMRFRRHDVQVKFGKPIPTADLAYEDREDLVERVHSAVVELHLSIGGQGDGQLEAEPESAVALELEETGTDLAPAYSYRLSELSR